MSEQEKFWKKMSPEEAPELIRDLESLQQHPGWKTFIEFMEAQAQMQEIKVLTSHERLSEQALRAALNARDISRRVIHWVPDNLQSAKDQLARKKEKDARHGTAEQPESGRRKQRGNHGLGYLGDEFDEPAE